MVRAVAPAPGHPAAAAAVFAAPAGTRQAAGRTSEEPRTHNQGPGFFRSSRWAMRPTGTCHAASGTGRSTPTSVSRTRCARPSATASQPGGASAPAATRGSPTSLPPRKTSSPASASTSGTACASGSCWRRRHAPRDAIPPASSCWVLTAAQSRSPGSRGMARPDPAGQGSQLRAADGHPRPLPPHHGLRQLGGAGPRSLWGSRRASVPRLLGGWR
jgi:hypothetical protein